jgi:hypothetical protein
MLSTGGPSRLGVGAMSRTAGRSVSRSSALRGKLYISHVHDWLGADRLASALGTQYMAAASISSAFGSRSALGLPPSIPLTTLDHGRLRFRNITTESQRSTDSNPPPLPLLKQGSSTKIATDPPLQASPPTPPLPISSIPPKITEIAAEKVEKELAKKVEKPKGSFPTRAWAKVKEEASHYWHGTKLLGQEIKISAKLQYKVLQGSTLTRRERRQVSFSVRRIPQADHL